MSHLLCLGFGYCARALARRPVFRDWRITGTTRSSETAARLTADGFTALVLSENSPSVELGEVMQDVTHVLVSVPPEAGGDPVLLRHRESILRAPALRWIGYLSTVGVYGDHAGGWVDEETLPRPVSEGARRRLLAERQWSEAVERTEVILQIFRLPGIYGPGRSAVDQIRSGAARRINKPGHVFNRIHVDDIGQVVEAAISRAGSHRVFNVADDEPASAADVVAYAAHLMGVAPPPLEAFATAALSPLARSFYAETKRVANQRIKTELGVQLAYPTYREGLTAIAAKPRI